MHLLILNWRDLRHPRAGGSEVYAQNLARCWAADGHEVTFFCAAVAGRPAVECQDGYRVVRSGGPLSVYRDARRFYLNQPAGTFDAVLDVINTRPFLTPRWVGTTPTVALIHQLAADVWRYEVPLPAALLGRYVLEPRWLAAYRRTPVLTVSESSRRSLVDYGLTDLRVVPEGVDPLIGRPLADKAASPTALFVGRLAHNKRPLDVLEAFAVVRRKLPDARLWIVGEGPLIEKMRRRAGPGVTLFGRVDAPTKQDLMASAHALVATSVREGWGLTVSEAAQVGTRAVAYDVPGLRDSVPAAGGVLVAPTPDALASALVEHLPTWCSEARPDLGSAGVVPWSRVAEVVLGHVEEAIG